MTSPGRLSGVDGLRGLAAVGVVLLHVWMYTGADEPDHSRLFDAFIGEWRLGLMYFFVLSGFLLGRPWVRAALDGRRRPELRSYAAHRVARIVPAYWVALAGAFLVLHGTGHDRAVEPGALPAYALFLQNQSAATLGQLNPPTWSLAVEVGFYLLLPLVGWAMVAAGARRGRGGIIAICVALIAAGLAWNLAGQLLAWPRTAITSPPTFLPVFVAGIAAAALCHGRAPSRRAGVALLALGWAAVVANGAWHVPGTGLVGHVLRDLPAAVGFGAIVVALTHRPPGVLDLPPIRWLGTVSYGMYVWHMPVMYWFVTRGRWEDAFLPSAVTVLSITVLCGWLSWVLVERPVLRRVAGRRARKAPRTARESSPARGEPGAVAPVSTP